MYRGGSDGRHLIPSIDADAWKRREERFKKKFDLGRKHLFLDVFPWLDGETELDQIALLITSTRRELAGGRVISIDEFVGDLRKEIEGMGRMNKNAIPEEYDRDSTSQ